MTFDRSKIGTNARPDLPLAVVVGAGGMALAIARRLGRSRRLLVADRDEPNLARVEQNLRGEGYDVQVCTCDVTDPAAVGRLAKTAEQAGGLQALAHVVGLSQSMADWATIMAVNLIGAVLVADAFLPLAGQGTAALFVSSLAAHIPLSLDAPWPELERLSALDDPLAPGFLDRLAISLGEEADSVRAYSDSKAAVIRLCQRYAKRWGARGARILSISPGLIATPMGALEFQNRPQKYTLLEATPITREGTVLEIAEAVEFLLSERASFISGIDILIDGGLAAALRYPGE
jgi:NAD(P)-dependent dehydrogenase (short-subunit alcohol dehydrogenase family)